MKAPMSSGSNFLVAMNCHRMGPSLSPSSTMPWVTNRVTLSLASASTLRLVQKREAFRVSTKPSGVSARHLAKVAGLKPE